MFFNMYFYCKERINFNSFIVLFFFHFIRVDRGKVVLSVQLRGRIFPLFQI